MKNQVMKKYVLCVNVNGEEFGIEGYTDLQKVKDVVKELQNDSKNAYYKEYKEFVKGLASAK